MIKSRSVDVAVVGGGLVGGVTALALAEAGLEVALVERAPPAHLAADAYDGRGSALALGSVMLLRALGLWEQLAPVAGPILDIRVSDGPSRLFLHYDHREVSDEALGYIVENRHLHRAIQSRPVPRIEAAVSGLAQSAGRAILTLGEAKLEAGLVVAADGRESLLRRLAGIGVTAWRYPQTALVCTVRHPEPHGGVAHERFLPPGPFALLPLADPHLSSIVWTEHARLAPHLLKLDDAGFSAEMTARFGPSLGPLTIQGRRWSWPLGLHHAERYVDRRLVLVGDAAHGIHPIAGQGLNLGLRDAAALAHVLEDGRALGLDPGDPMPLLRYQRWRRPDNVALLVATDALNRLFTTELAPVRLARDLGLAAVDKLPGLKRLFMRHAMGLIGDQPRLVQRGSRDIPRLPSSSR